MNRLKWLWIPLLAMAFVACGVPPEASTEDVSNSTSGAIDLNESEAADSDVEEAAEAVEETAEEPEPATVESEPEEVVEEPAETASATAGDDVFPAVDPQDALVERSFDHAKGSEEPVVTVIEYGDFQ